MLHERGLNPGRAGNVSVRFSDRMLITPSGAPYPTLVPSELVDVSLLGEDGAHLRPSSEWRLHRDVYRDRPDVLAVVHTHAPHATAIACLRREIPAFHYMVAVAGGSNIRCAPYATFGSQILSDNVVRALEDRQACLLASHGLVTVGGSLDEAADLTLEVEALCEVYLHALEAGTPVILSDQEMADVIARFASYGNPRRIRPE